MSLSTLYLGVSSVLYPYVKQCKIHFLAPNIYPLQCNWCHCPKYHPAYLINSDHLRNIPEKGCLDNFNSNFALLHVPQLFNAVNHPQLRWSKSRIWRGFIWSHFTLLTSRLYLDRPTFEFSSQFMQNWHRYNILSLNWDYCTWHSHIPILILGSFSKCHY